MPHIVLPIVLSPTRAELGRRCHRRHFITDVLERGKYKSASALFGTALHEATGELWRSRLYSKDYQRSYEDGLMALHRNFDAASKEAEMTAKHSLEMAERLFDFYASTAEIVGPFSSAGEWEPLTLETRLEQTHHAPGFLSSAILSFKQDRVLYNKELNWVINIDLKTASRFDIKWERSWHHSLQMKLYRAAMVEEYSHLGNPRIDVMIEGLLKAAKTQMKYIVLPEWSPEILFEAKREFLRIAEKDTEILTAALLPDGSFDLDILDELAVNSTSFNDEDCYAYGFECPLRAVCDAEPSQRVGLLRADYDIIPQDY